MAHLNTLCKLFNKPISDRAALATDRRWPIGYNIKVKFLDGQPWQHAWVEKVVTESVLPFIHPSLSITFVDKKQFADVRITFDFKEGYGTSLIGTDCTSVATQSEPSMKLNKLDNPESFVWKNQTYSPGANIQTDSAGYVVKHEWCHVFLFYHEHLNPHYTNPIEWNVEEVYKYYGTGDGAWTTEAINANILDRVSKDRSVFTPFDKDSISLYTFPKHLTKNGIEFAVNTEYSLLDKKFMKENTVNPNTVPLNRSLISFDEQMNIGISQLNLVLLMTIISMIMVILYLYMNKKKK